MIVWPEVTRKLTVTESAARKLGELAAWLATMVQVPTLLSERLAPEVISQTERVEEVYVLVNPVFVKPAAA